MGSGGQPRPALDLDTQGQEWQRGKLRIVASSQAERAALQSRSPTGSGFGMGRAFICWGKSDWMKC